MFKSHGLNFGFGDRHFFGNGSGNSICSFWWKCKFAGGSVSVCTLLKENKILCLN